MISRKAPLWQWGGMLLNCIFILMKMAPAMGADIAALTQGPFHLSKGDQITLEARSARSPARVEWWSGAELLCDQARCLIDTSSFTPGEYRYEVIISDDAGIATATVSVSANETRPLYVPKRLTPPSEAVSSDLTIVKNGEWIIVARAGGVTTPNPRNRLNPKRVDSFAGVIDGAIYDVAGGSQAILRRIGFDEEWLISSGSSFMFRNNSFELLSGQGIWRIINNRSPSSAEAGVAGAHLTAKGAVFLHAAIGQTPDGVKKALLRNFEGDQVGFSCGSTSAETLDAATSKAITVEPSGACSSIQQEVFNAGDPALVIRAWYPWWVGKGNPTSSDRWRAEWSLIKDKRAESQILSDALAAQSARHCSDALDMVGAIKPSPAQRGKFVKIAADCQFSLGLYAKSLDTYTGLDASGDNPNWAAFMIARANQSLGHNKLALQWFHEALNRGFEPRTQLVKYAIEAAKADNNPIEQLRWLELLSVQASDEAGYLSALSDVNHWRVYRPWGGVVTGEVFMDNQALPVNAKKTSPMPQNAKKSRSLMIGAIGDWWKTQRLGQDLNFKLKGTHELYAPTESSIVFASRSVHELTAEITIGEHGEEPRDDLDRWTGTLAAIVGTGISGGERQRDRMGWSINIRRPRWNHLTFGLKSDKYLDPNPGGVDLIDLDLNRYTGETDHSHLDVTFLTTAASKNGILTWWVSGEYGNVDYRTGLMDQFDHSLLRLAAKLSWAVARRLDLFIDPDFLSRTYKNNGGSDQIIGARSGARILVAPLWIAMINVGVENRDVSKDRASSWSRLVYGLGVSAEL